MEIRVQALVKAGKLKEGSKVALFTSEGGSIALRTSEEGYVCSQ